MARWVWLSNRPADHASLFLILHITQLTHHGGHADRAIIAAARPATLVPCGICCWMNSKILMP